MRLKNTGHRTYGWALGGKDRLKGWESKKIKLMLLSAFSLVKISFPKRTKNSVLLQREVAGLWRRAPCNDAIMLGLSVQSLIWECAAIQFFRFIQSIRFKGLTHTGQNHGKQMCKSKCHFINLQRQVESTRRSDTHSVSSTFSPCGEIYVGSQIIIRRQPDSLESVRRGNWLSEWNVKGSWMLQSPPKGFT